MTSNLSGLTASLRVPALAWRAAGLAPDPHVETLADCTVGQLQRFAEIDAKTADGRLFRQRARQCLEHLEDWVDRPDNVIQFRLTV